MNFYRVHDDDQHDIVGCAFLAESDEMAKWHLEQTYAEEKLPYIRASASRAFRKWSVSWSVAARPSPFAQALMDGRIAFPLGLARIYRRDGSDGLLG